MIIQRRLLNFMPCCVNQSTIEYNSITLTKKEKNGFLTKPIRKLCLEYISSQLIHHVLSQRLIRYLVM